MSFKQEFAERQIRTPWPLSLVFVMPRPKRQLKHLAMVRSKSRQAINPAASNMDADSENDTDNEIIVVPEETLDDSAVNRAYDHVLRWVDGARPKRPAVYHGTSERTKFRRQKNQKTMHEAAKGSIQITAFFQSAKNKSQEDEQDIEEVPELRIPTFTETVEKALELLRPMTTQVCNQRVENRMRDISKYDFVRLMAVKRYLYRIQSNQESHVCAPNKIAGELYPDSKTEWKARFHDSHQGSVTQALQLLP